MVDSDVLPAVARLAEGREVHRLAAPALVDQRPRGSARPRPRHRRSSASAGSRCCGPFRTVLPAAPRRPGSRFPGRGFSLKSFQDLAGRDDQLVRVAKQVPVDDLVDPAAALAGAEAQLALPRRGEQQAVPVEAPAAEDAPGLQPVDGRERVLGVDADLVLDLAHSRRLPPAGQLSRPATQATAGSMARSRTFPKPITSAGGAAAPG